MALGKASVLLITGIKIAPTIIFRRALTTNLLIIKLVIFSLFCFPLYLMNLYCLAT